MAGPPEFIHGTKAAHGYLEARLGDLAPNLETFRCYVGPRWKTGAYGEIPEGFPQPRKVPCIRSKVFLRGDLDRWCIRVLNAADPDRVTSLRARIRAANDFDAAVANETAEGAQRRAESL